MLVFVEHTPIPLADCFLKNCVQLGYSVKYYLCKAVSYLDIHQDYILPETVYLECTKNILRECGII